MIRFPPKRLFVGRLLTVWIRSNSTKEKMEISGFQVKRDEAPKRDVGADVLLPSKPYQHCRQNTAASEPQNCMKSIVKTARKGDRG